MSLTREIITLQLGNYSNYVGTHWWNIQVINNKSKKHYKIYCEIL